MEPRPDAARFSRPALVLGGGGAYGVIQAAYICAAYEAGFRPSIVVGTSVGSRSTRRLWHRRRFPVYSSPSR